MRAHLFEDWHLRHPGMRYVLVALNVCSQVAVLAYLAMTSSMGLFVVLAALSSLAVLTALVLSRVCGRRPGPLWDRSFDQLIYWMPWTFLTLYAYIITSETRQGACDWYIPVQTLRKLVPMSVLTMRVAMAVFSAVGLVQMVQAAFNIDLRASRGCTERVHALPRYGLAHLALRGSELCMRGISGVIFCECIHLSEWEVVEVARAYPPLDFLLPLLLLLSAHFAILYWSNGRADGQLRDSPLAVCIVALATLGFNPVLFLDRQSCRQAASRARWRVAALQRLEVLVFSAAVWMTSLQHVPADRCRASSPGEIAGAVLLERRPSAVLVLILSTALHYGLLSFHGEIRRGVNRLTAEDSDLVIGGVAADFQAALLRQLPDRGMCRMLVQLSGSSLLEGLVPAARPDAAAHYRLLSCLGHGGYGVVCLVEREAAVLEHFEPPLFAMKLLNTDPRRNIGASSRLLAPGDVVERECSTYRRIWQELEVLDDGQPARTGHPFIVRLHCFCSMPRGRAFSIPEERADGAVGRSPVVSLTGEQVFHEALVMEFCEGGTLEAYVRANLPHGGCSSLDDFLTVRRFLAEIVLALDFLHSVKGIVYRDLKLDNVFVVNKPHYEGPHLKLGDFGFSKDLRRMEHPRSIESDFEEPVTTVGTKFWWAPEMMQQAVYGQLLDACPSGQFSLDIFSLGCVAFALGHGYPYLPAEELGIDHPVCQKFLRPDRSCRCAGCSTLCRLEGRFPTTYGNRCLLNFARGCLAHDGARRPRTATLRRQPLFCGGCEGRPPVDFAALLALEI